MSKTELLAPAGNFECLAAAVQNGADAVYFAGKKFGARSYAQNFSEEEIKRAIDYCGLRGVKTHIAVNTAYSDNEVADVLEYVNFLYKEGADALIVSDVGLISEIKRYFPRISVHASTQMTIHSLDGVKFAERLGADRVVLSRELPFSEIDYISSNCLAEIEIFVHGALCMCYSGQCLLSSMIGGRSGNRGSCAQPCRLPFGAYSDDKKFILSLKDLSLVNHIKRIENSKIRSVKIEGRMKGAQYVAAVVSTYRRYLDNPIPVLEKDREILEKIFYRGGLTDGYFSYKKGSEMFAFEKPDNPYLKQTKQILADYSQNFEEAENRKIDITFNFYAKVGKPPVAIVKYGKTEALYEHNDIICAAKNKPADIKSVEAQLLKTGGTPFNISSLNIDLGEGAFLSKSIINEIRRNALLALEEKLIKSGKRDSEYGSADKAELENIISDGYTVYVSSAEQLKAVLQFDFNRIYIGFELAEETFYLSKEHKARIALALPEIAFDRELEAVEKVIYSAKENGINKLLINNPSQLKYFEEFELILSQRFNIWNGYSLKVYAEDYGIKAAFLSPELNLKAITKMNKPTEIETIVYGYIPVMVTENCIIKNTGRCPCNSEFMYITDRTGARFPVKKAGGSCRSILYNSVPLYLADKIDLIDKTGCIKNLYFTIESPDSVKEICSEYFFNKYSMPESYTRGHYFK